VEFFQLVDVIVSTEYLMAYFGETSRGCQANISGTDY
jgi:hypothetical protein